jgi:hypothetical protein
LLSASAAGAAEPAKESANELLPACKAITTDNHGNAHSQGYCLGILRALAYALPEVCGPAGATNKQAVRLDVVELELRAEQSYLSDRRMLRSWS